MTINWINLDGIPIREEFYVYSFYNRRDFAGEYKLAPFRPECYGGIFYPLSFYMADKYHIKMVHYGEANLLPFYALNSHEARFFSFKKSPILKGYDFDNHKVTYDYTIMENIQRRCSEELKKDEEIEFGYRTFFPKNFDSLVRKIALIYNISAEEVRESIDYYEFIEFTKQKWLDSNIYLWEDSSYIYDELLKDKEGKFWFASHARDEFAFFERLFLKLHPELVIEETLLDNRYPIYRMISDVNVDAVLSTQILASLSGGIRFILSGGSVNLMYNIPYVNVAHATHWDHWMRELKPLKFFFQKKYFGSEPIEFNVGGQLNNYFEYPIKNYQSFKWEKIPFFGQKLKRYDGPNVMVYVREVLEALNKMGRREIEKIIEYGSIPSD